MDTDIAAVITDVGVAVQHRTQQDIPYYLVVRLFRGYRLLCSRLRAGECFSSRSIIGAFTVGCFSAD